jgi:hypothetical protein
MILFVKDYGCQVYCSLTAADVNRLEQLHYRAGMIITASIKNSSYAKILTELGWTTLSERRNYFQACLMYKTVNGLSQLYLQNLILNRRPARQLQMNLHNADHLPVPRFRLKTFEINFKVSGIRL